MDQCKKRVLVVDDSVDNQLLIKTLLESSGCVVECASDGAQALRMARRSKKQPSLILLDLQMPVMNGYDFRTEQQADANLKDIPVLVMTADGGDGMDLELNHPSGVLLKPLSVSRLLSSVSSLLVG